MIIGMYVPLTSPLVTNPDAHDSEAVAVYLGKDGQYSVYEFDFDEALAAAVAGGWAPGEPLTISDDVCTVAYGG